jgi:hypothetical protein
MSAPNIASLSSIIGKTAMVSSVATGGSSIIASVTANHVYKLNSVIAANKTASAAYITLYITRSAVNYNIAYQITVPANASLIIVGKDAPLYMEESDVLTGIAGTATAIDVMASYEDIS